MFDDLKLSKITGFLFSDNSRMINIHKKCGWITVDVVPIKKIFTEEETVWEEITTKSNNENVERYFNKIELTRENIMKNFDDIKYKLLV
jgi:RimJ/RimL family protein N-acetyltransferase